MLYGTKLLSGTSGAAKNFITRTQAVRKLQISLPDFRRLCIFKGIYPREPRNKKKAKKGSTASTTFYYTKDIQYLLHEPLLRKFREHKALAKKIGRALGRNEVGDAKRLERSKPRMTLDHIVKERYPTFVDALRDLDDALSMLFLFASLPSTTYVSPKTITLCQRLCHEFQHYLIVTHSLQKSFLSIKGIYYQATIQGQDIFWLVPYKFVQRMTGDIDFRIMSTFIDFYTTLLGFVNYRLYTSVGLVYPPKFSSESDDQGAELAAFTLEGRAVEPELPQATITNGDEQTTATTATTNQISSLAQAEADRLALTTLPDPDATTEPPTDDATSPPPTDALDTFTPLPSLGGDILPQPQHRSTSSATLFASLTVFLSRETPRTPLEFLLRAFGCVRVQWAGSGDEASARITHEVVDRPADGPAAHRRRRPGRAYVQPQWVWDCVNAARLLRTDLYAPGVTLPPHLSPWVRPSAGAYDPTRSVEEQEAEGEREADEQREQDGEVQVQRAGRNGVAEEVLDREDDGGVGEGMEVAESEESEDEDEEDEHEQEEPQNDNFDGFSDEEADAADGDEVAQRRYQAELEAEALGLPVLPETNGKAQSEARKKAERRKKQEEEDLERRKMMMPNRKRKLFERMEYGNKKRQDEAAKLRQKRRKLEKDGVR